MKNYRKSLLNLAYQNKYSLTMVHHLIQKNLQKKEGFQLHRVTPLYPRANGQMECFMQVLNKTELIAHFQWKTGLGRNMAVHDMLMAC